ncbi:hypothetical protein [Halioxenophilus aromaticivorans]|uniref:Cardiolipin synthase N-terminal domain-containing protein n=1 Tax=Halioxenophilus aromaticivorans TaxID=1306992 RepID=A0AAV3TVZ8_9ALTE
MDTLLQILFFPIIAVIWLIPLAIIALSSKTSGSEKIAWILLVIFVSWFAWVFYMLFAPLKKQQ